MQDDQIKKIVKDFFHKHGTTIAEKHKELEYEYGRDVADRFFKEVVKYNKNMPIPSHLLLK